LPKNEQNRNKQENVKKTSPKVSNFPQMFTVKGNSKSPITFKKQETGKK